LPQALGDVTAAEAGRFQLSVTPESPSIAIVVREGRKEREWPLSVTLTPQTRVNLLTDRVLYEPGETINAWVRVVDNSSEVPMARRNVEWTIGGTGGTPRLGQSRTATSESGVATARVSLPSSAPDGMIPVTALIDGTPHSVQVQVGRRTVERVFASMTINQQVVQPGSHVTGSVTVRTPSGAAVRGASVSLTMGGRDAGSVSTDAEGIAQFNLSAPSYLRESISSVSIFARVTHAAYGTIATTGTFTLARVPYEVETQMANGALVPEVPQNLFLTLTDPVGEPPPIRTGVTIEGPAVLNGRFHGSTDRHGMITVPMRLPRNAAAVHENGRCSGHTATSFDVVVESQVPLAARLCERANTSATVVPRVLSPSVVAGSRVDIAIDRAPSVRSKSVAVELLYAGPRAQDTRAVLGTAIAAPGDGRVSMNIPPGYLGAVFVRARPIGGDGAAEGTGALDSMMVRPAHMFDLAISADKDLYHIRETAHLTVVSPPGLQGAHVAFVARDLAAHGGERGWQLSWLGAAFSDALEDATTSDGDRFVRSALAAHLSADTDPLRAQPLLAPQAAQEEASEESAEREGDLRDPIVLRDELVRRGVGTVMMALEAAVENATGSTERNHVIAAGGRFDPAVVHHLIAEGTLDHDNAVTLGGDEITVAMLQAADPSFSFDHVARRVARKRLVGLLASVANFAESSRIARTEPQERWLSRIAGNNPGLLRDPWGGAYVLRRVAPGTEPIAVHTRLSGWELVSPGPDRVVGTADDVKNPFERAIPQGTVYAVASGEDNLMAALAALDPGQEVLNRIIAAYGRLADAATEETAGDVVEAQASESMAPAAPGAMRAYGGLGVADDLSISGTGMGGGGYGSGSGYGRSGHASSVRTASPVIAGQSQAVRMSGQFFGARSAALSALVRERFPATLKVLDEQSLDPSGRTVLDLPLADALTTYRVEAIAWTREGWTTSRQFELRVDQDAIVDSPVPPFTVVGDVIRLPLRLQNRTSNTLSARLAVTAEGEFEIEGVPSGVVEVAARDGSETIVEVRMTRPGRGALVISASNANGGALLDAARRPMEVLLSARPVRSSVEALVDGRTEMTLALPPDAVYRTQGVLRVSRSEVLFGDAHEWMDQAPDITWPAWVLALQNERPPSFSASRANYSTERLMPFAHSGNAETAARAISALWLAPEITDAILRGCLEQLGRRQEAIDRALRVRRTVGGSGTFQGTEPSIQTLISLAPAIENRALRPALQDLLTQIVSQARQVVENETTVETSSVVFARAAAALTLSGQANEARVQEFLRRAARGEEDEFGAESEFAESENMSGFFAPNPRDTGERVEALAAYGIARLREGNRSSAFQTLRALARRAPNVAQWNPLARALAMALATKITAGIAPLSPAVNATVGTTPNASAPSAHIVLDGRAFDVPIVQGVGVLLARELSTAGRHRIVLELPAGTVMVAQAEARYGRPWAVQPTPRGPIGITLEGEPGPRDTRASFVLRLQNRSPRVISSPLLEVDVPAGVELDQDTRVVLERRLAQPAVLTGRTLALRLRALSPGGFVRIPLPLRWSVSGTLNGLGVAAYASDELNAGVTVLQPRVLTIVDQGAEAARPDLRSRTERQTRSASEVSQ
jgi:hypothetical protein